MDKPVLDELARGVSQLRNRRTALAMASAAVLGFGLGSERSDAKKKKKKQAKKRQKRCLPGDADIGFLCCIYRCDATNPPTYKSYCIEGAERGKTRCNSSLEGCSFNEANYRESCAACTALP